MDDKLPQRYVEITQIKCMLLTFGKDIHRFDTANSDMLPTLDDIGRLRNRVSELSFLLSEAHLNFLVSGEDMYQRLLDLEEVSATAFSLIRKVLKLEKFLRNRR